MRGSWAGAGAGSLGAGLSLWDRLSAVALTGAELVRTWARFPPVVRMLSGDSGISADGIGIGMRRGSVGVSPPVPCRPPVPWARLSPALRLRGFLRTAPGDRAGESGR